MNMPKSVFSEPFREYVNLLSRWLRIQFFMHDYNMRVILSEESFKPDQDPENTTLCTMRSDTVYLWFKMTIYPELAPFWNRGDYREVAEDILHEFVHVLIEPIMAFFMWDVPSSQRGFAISNMERQVVRITTIMADLMGPDWYAPERLLKYFDDTPKEIPNEPKQI